jgi:TPR repeat protein
MRLISIALIAALSAPLPSFAAPTEEDVATARLAYIRGDYGGALDVIKEAAEAGNAKALNILGAAYEEGRGVEVDRPRAIALFEQAAKAGEVRARYNLGTIYAFGSGEIPMDRDQAKREFRLAASAGYAPAMTALGQLRETATPPDHDAAADWYEKADDKGDVVATANLAHAYVTGQGRPENWSEARVLYTEAAERGYPRAYNDLGVMHQKGYGVHADVLTAFTYFLVSVERGYAKAGVNMAELIIKARFPFSSNHAAMGYCLWAVENATPRERDGFQQECDALDVIIKPDEATPARARLFADRL